MRTFFQLCSTVALGLVLQACGGGGGSGQLTAQFVDDPVEGLAYECVSSGGGNKVSGVTNAQGQFSYLPGQTCTFSVGKVVVGSVAAIPADGLVTPHDVAGVARSVTSAASAPKVAVIAQFLQSLNEPGSSGRIRISSTATQALAALPATRLVDDATGPLTPEGLRTVLSAAGKTPVPAAQAMAALDTGLSTGGVSRSAGSVGAGSNALSSVTVSASAESLAAGAVLKLTAMKNLTDGSSSIADGTVSWTSSDSSLATVGPDGTVTSRKPGKVRITAATGGVAGSMDLTVTDAVLQSLSLPAGLDDPLPLGVTRALSLVGTYSDGSEKTFSKGVTWSVANTHASVDGEGLLTAVGLGAVDVVGTVAGVSKTFSLTVSPAVLRSITLARADGGQAAIAAGRTVQLKASGSYSDGSEQDISANVSWSAATNDSLSVSSGGLVTTRAAGTGRVSVVDSTSGVSATLALEVGDAVLDALDLGAAQTGLAEGLNQQLTLTGVYSDGSRSTSLTGVSWTSSDAGKVSVVSNGLVSGLAQGNAVITATVGSVSTQLTVNVTAPVAQSLSVSALLNTIANGASTALNALVTLSNNAVQAVASAVTWVVESLGGSAEITVSGDTVTLTGTAPGDVKVTGTYQGVSGSTQLKITPSISGVAANGAAMEGAKVTLMDASGQTLTVSANDNGGFVFPDLTGYREPFQVSATAQVGARQVTQYAIYANALAGGSNTVNVTPLTSAIAALVAPSGVVADLSPAQLSAITPSQVSAVTSQVVAVIAPLVSSIKDMPSVKAFDPMTTTFAANGTGPDRLLDFLDVSVRPDGVAIANKMVVPSADSTADAAATLAKGNSGSVTPLVADVVDLDGIEDLVAQFKRCFAVSADQRLTGKSAGSATLANECSTMALPQYLHNGNTFMSRWAGLLNSASMNASARFSRPEFRLRLNSNPDVIAVNFNMVDKDGVGYTLPEIIQKQADGSWRLYGNQRKANAFVETSLIHYQDMTPNTSYNNINYSRMEVGFRFNFDPRLTFSGSEPTYQGIDMRETGAYATTNWSSIRSTGATMVKCVAVMGPGNFTANGAKWMGIYPYGLLLKKPTSSVRQDYMAIDRRLGQGEQNTLLNTPVGGAVPSTLCPLDASLTGTTEGGYTASSSNTYAVDLQPLLNQKHPLTGQPDSALDGRDRAWYTGPRFARISPDAALTAIFQSNPKFTFYVIDTNDVLQMKMDTRYLGELPSLAQFSAMVQSNKLPTWSKESIARYLDYSAGQAARTAITVDWVNPVKGFNTDYAGFYSEVYQSTPGAGLRGASSSVVSNRTNVGADGLWTSDSDLASYIDALPGTNFFWRYSTITKASDVSGACTGAYLSSNGGFGVYRSITSIDNQNLASNWLGTDTLQGACRKMAGAPTQTSAAYLLREMYLRTYSDKNARIYNYVANKKLQ